MQKADRTRVVIFTTNNARVVKTDKPEKYKNRPNVLFNPDLSKVKGVRPEFWTFKKGQIVEMNSREKRFRQAMIAKHGIDNKLPPKLHLKPLWPLYLTLSAAGLVAIGAAVWLYF